jgi:hypothetical protein
MENRGSKGATFLAWIFIISAIIGSLPALNLKHQMQINGSHQADF